MLVLVAEIRGNQCFSSISKLPDILCLLDFRRNYNSLVQTWIGCISKDPNLALWGLPSAVLGHISLFQILKVEKGCCNMGGLLGAMPVYLLIGLVSWLVIFFTTRYVAIASLALDRSAFLFSNFIFFAEDNGGQLSR